MVVKDVGSRIRRRGLMLVSVVALGRRQVDHRAQPDRERSGFELSVSVTTRPRRGSEIEGVHYHFVSQREFDSLRDSDALLEWAEVHGNFYATPREPAEKAMAEGRDMLFDIDWQGAKQLQGEDARRHRLDLHPAAVDEGVEGAAEAPRRGPGSGDRDAPEERPHRDRALDASTTSS